MSKVTGKGKKEEVIGQRSIDELRSKINRLHAERGAAVIEAKKAREEQGFKSAAFQLDWEHIEDLTRAIVHYEAELERALAARGGAEDAERAPLLRDPEKENPDDLITVIVVTDNAERYVANAYRDEEGWLDELNDDPMDGSIIGWCHQEEAAEVLKAATREVRHG